MSAHASPALSTARRGRLLLHTLLLALALALTWAALPVGTASAAAPAVLQCNGTDNVGGRAVECDVTIENSLDLATGVASSTVTVRECSGAAGAAPLCTTETRTFADVTTTVEQCNGSGSGGGGTVTCSVRVTNTIIGDATLMPATVNQCNGSGGGGGTEPTVACSPVASTTSATVTQCNDSGNGGGGTMRVRCTVGDSTQTAALPISINQCNGSGNGGGGTVTCSSSVTNRIQAAAPPEASPSPSVSPSPAASPEPSPSPSPSLSPQPAASATPTASISPSPGASPPAPASPSPEASPSAAPAASPAAPAPVTDAPLDGVAPDSGTPIVVVVPEEGITGGTETLTPTVTSLPRTGADLTALWLTGLLMALVGGAFMLTSRRPTGPAGRHVLS